MNTLYEKCAAKVRLAGWKFPNNLYECRVRIRSRRGRRSRVLPRQSSLPANLYRKQAGYEEVRVCWVRERTQPSLSLSANNSTSRMCEHAGTDKPRYGLPFGSQCIRNET